jgi:hypothetical protein
MGTNGMSVKNTIIIGKTARKKLNATDDARVVIEPLKIPWKKKEATLYSDIPSNPGKTMRFVNFKNFNTGLYLTILYFILL